MSVFNGSPPLVCFFFCIIHSSPRDKHIILEKGKQKTKLDEPLYLETSTRFDGLQ